MPIGKGKTPGMDDIFHLVDKLIKRYRNRKKGGRIGKFFKKIGAEARR